VKDFNHHLASLLGYINLQTFVEKFRCARQTDRRTTKALLNVPDCCLSHSAPPVPMFMTSLCTRWA